MVFKCRVRAGTATVRVCIDNGDETWGNLRQVLAKAVHIDIPEDLKISLNKHDVIAADDSASLGEIGLCSGDTLWVLNAPSKAVHTDRASQPSTQNVPFLEQVVALVHAAMTAQGFEAHTTATNPLNTSLVRLSCTINADPHTNATASAELTCCTMPDTTVLVAAALRDSTQPARRTTVHCMDAAPSQIHSAVVLPIALDACRALGVPYPGGLLALPDGLLERCLTRLPAVDLARCACVSRMLRASATGDALWKHLYIEDFGQPPHDVVAHAAQHGWMCCFANKWQAHKAAVRASSRLAARQPPGVRLAFPGPYAVVPGMIGGDLDRLPVPGLGPRDPLRQWALPGTGLPQGPVLRDPFAPPRRGRRSAWQLH